MGGSVGSALGTEGGWLDKNLGAVGGTLMSPSGIGFLGTLGGMSLDQAREAANQSHAGYDSSGRPVQPGFNSALDENGKLKKEFQANGFGGVTPDQRGLDAFRERALSTGPSSWQNLANQQVGQQEQQGRSRALSQGASAAAQARSNLSSKYGLSKGASERLAMQNQRDQLTSQQGIGQQANAARLNNSLQDEQMKNQFLQALPGQDNAQAQIGIQNRGQNMQGEQFNATNALAQNAAQNTFNQNNYANQMAAYGAQQNANAMRQSGSGSKK